ncbi:ABC transporter permease [Aquisalibacillus elongatus]|uniref:Oligopeptide transport system permease protein n=1 Tax=Aquisalibacillus elongatus TaxID=485577 RepID=A0A3N5B1G6_9BACI|nr:ABC transporter permease [Aquisalibacillus elongatus]RPF51073.1 oligopeptide transport system permease protein [Aquisalibacillus elongatus]
MVWQITKQILIFCLILIGFILLLLLPREREIEMLGPMQFEADYPFTLELYQESIQDFVSYVKVEKGFGETTGGNSIWSESQRFLNRSLKIIIPAFILSMVVGILIGMLQIHWRNRKKGKVIAFFSWLFAAIPDFFLFISIQYLLIVLMRNGLPQFSIFGDEHWYNFIIPLVALMIFPIAHLVKFTVVSMENEMGQDYVRTAFSKGMTRLEAIKHMFWNSFGPLMNQSQMVMLYILSSLPIIEKVSNYNGAGYQLLESILANEEMRALALMIPFLFIMFIVVLTTQVLKHQFVPKDVTAK